MYKNLVLNVGSFQHPGYNNVIEQYQGKEMSGAYAGKTHSLNANLVVCHLTVGRV